MHLSTTDVRIRLYAGIHLYDLFESSEYCANYCTAAYETLKQLNSTLTVKYETDRQTADFSGVTIEGEEVEEYLSIYPKAVDATEKIEALIAELAQFMQAEKIESELASDTDELIDYLDGIVTVINSLQEKLDAITSRQTHALVVRVESLSAYNQAKNDVVELVKQFNQYARGFNDHLSAALPELEHGYQAAINSKIGSIEDPMASGGIEEVVHGLKEKRYIESPEKTELTQEQETTNEGAVEKMHSGSSHSSPAASTDGLEKLAAELTVPSITQRAARDLLNQFQRLDSTLRESQEVIHSAVLYIACRQNGVPRSPAEFAAVTTTNKQVILEAVASIADTLNIELSPAHPLPFVERYGTELELDAETRELAAKIVNHVVTDGSTSGRKPASITAGVLYAAAQHTGTNITQETIADAVGVSAVSIRNQYQKYLDIIDELDSESD